jgi:hypothetical protein
VRPYIITYVTKEGEMIERSIRVAEICDYVKYLERLGNREIGYILQEDTVWEPDEQTEWRDFDPDC